MIAGTSIPVGSGSATVLPDFDFETYSDAGYYFDPATGRYKGITKTNPGLPAVGAAVYAEHPSTEVISMAYDLKDGKGPRLWIPGMLPPQELFDHIAAGGLLEAWNSGFEFLIWKHVCHARMGWPELPPATLRCAMAKGKAFGLPGKLGKAADVLGASEQKDKRGEQLIRLLSIPRKPTKADKALRCQDPALLGEMYSYNIQDIKAEAAVSQATPDLSPSELALWQLDQKINQQGVHIDRVALDNCLEIVRQATDRYTAELRDLTGGEVQTAGEIAKIQRWLDSQGVHTRSLDSEAVEHLLSWTDASMPTHCRRVLEIRSSLGAASVKKLFAIDRMLPSDSRLKDLFAFCGADRTKRWAGRGAQPQNFPNSGPKVAQCADCGKVFWAEHVLCTCGGLGSECDWGIDAVNVALGDIATRNLDWVESQWGDAVAAVAGCLRGLFSAAPGHDLICSDFSAIEAVVMAFLAGEEWRMEVFRTHGKIYEASASMVSGVSLDEILDHKKTTGQHHPLRKKGKINELSMAYGGGLGAAKAFGAGAFMDDEEIQKNVWAWRSASPAVAGRGPDKREPIGIWKGLENAAYAAIRQPGSFHQFRGIGYGMKDGILYCRLPSGGFLTYHNAQLEMGVTPWGAQTLRMTYRGWNTNYLQGPTGWMKMDTYGPKLAENCVQGIARDIMANSMMALDAAGYPIVLHIHDEIVSEVPKGFGSVEEFEKIMATMPAWCADWPIRAAGGWRGLRYRKD